MNIPLLVFNDVSGLYISGIESKRGAITVTRHVHDLGELLGLAQTGIARAVLMVSGSELITASTLASLQGYGLAVVILRDPGEEITLGHETVVSTLASIDEVIEGIETAVAHWDGYSYQTTSESETETEAVAAPESETAEILEQKNGKILVFWGTAGAPGRSTFATHTAAYLAEQKMEVCLIDADTYSPSIFAILGMSEDYSTLSQLSHLAEKGELSAEKFKETVSTIRHGKTSFDVATGITSAERWPEIRQVAFEKVLEVAKQNYDAVIVDVNHLVEADEELSFEGIVPLRNGCSISALQQADHLYILGNGDAIGIPRLLKSLESITAGVGYLQVEGSIHLWVNKVRSSAAGHQAEQQLKNAWSRYQGLQPIEGFIPWEPEVLDKALLTGQTLSEVGKKNALLQVLEKMTAPIKFQQGSISREETEAQEPRQPALVVQREGEKKTESSSRFHRLLAGKRLKSR